MSVDSEKSEQYWDLIIRSRVSWWDIDLKGLTKFKELIFLFVRRDFVAIYKQTILGPLWMFLQPMLTVMLFALVFGRIANIPTGGLPPLLFYLPAYVDRKSTRLNSSHIPLSRMPSSA